MIQKTVSHHVEPRDAIELALVHIWEDLLDRRPIGIYEDFFQLGGDSISAMQLLARIAKEMGFRLPSRGLVAAPTIAQLAKALRDGCSSDSWSPLVPIQRKGSRLPFFCVHPGGGNVLCYLPLSRRLGPDQPFFGLQSPGVDGICEPLRSVEDLARRYVRAVREVRPRGPYAVGGWSTGGVIAFEMARQLQELNEQVQTLAIIDSGVLHACAVVTSMFPRGQPGVYDLMRRPFAETVEGFRQISSSARLIPEAADDEQAARIYSLFTSHVDAVLKYRPKRYTGEIQLFQAKDQLVRERFEPYREWCQICDQVQLHLVPGDHLNMVQAPHVDTLAEKLGRCLAA